MTVDGNLHVTCTFPVARRSCCVYLIRAMTVATATTKLVRTIHTSTKGINFELTTFRGGKLEVYREYADQPGMFEFLGYYQDLASSPVAAQVHPFIAAHQAVCRQACEGWLPGAAAWAA